MKKTLAHFLKVISVLLLFIGYLRSVSPVAAVCPVCTVAVGGGVLLSHYLGIDDLVIGIWAGGLVVSLGLWTGNGLKKIYFKGQAWVWTAFLWLTTVWGLKQSGFIGHPTCKIHGHDKLLTGIVAGSLAFLLGNGLDYGLRKLNRGNPGKALFPYQRVIIPILLLLIVTVIGLKICQIPL